MKYVKIAVGLLCVMAVGLYAYSEISENEIAKVESAEQKTEQTTIPLKVGAERMEVYLPLLQGKNVGVVGNQTSVVKQTHLVDTLIKRGVSVKKIFTPEHGFRGTADAGASVNNGVDEVTGLPLISLYGKHKKPTPDDFQGIDVIVFDIQDVGARFYTYISTMHYVMEACAENNVPCIVLDRPNPNGFYVDGPVLKLANQSFVGMHPVPIVHGMTIGEYAQMINGEKWLANDVKCDLKVIPCEGYDHTVKYKIPIPPSPNLPNMQAIYLYPTLCLFEGTVMSVGRGTDFPFQVVGHPQYKDSTFFFRPESRTGASSPLYENKKCYGKDFRTYDVSKIHSLDISIWKEMYKQYGGNELFFNRFFIKLAGTPDLQRSIELGLSEEKIRESWKQDLDLFRQIRQKYLLYKDF